MVKWNPLTPQHPRPIPRLLTALLQALHAENFYVAEHGTVGATKKAFYAACKVNLGDDHKSHLLSETSLDALGFHTNFLEWLRANVLDGDDENFRRSIIEGIDRVAEGRAAAVESKIDAADKLERRRTSIIAAGAALHA